MARLGQVRTLDVVRQRLDRLGRAARFELGRPVGRVTDEVCVGLFERVQTRASRGLFEIDRARRGRRVDAETVREAIDRLLGAQEAWTTAKICSAKNLTRAARENLRRSFRAGG